jgi:hypothetical protein
MLCVLILMHGAFYLQIQLRMQAHKYGGCWMMAVPNMHNNQHSCELRQVLKLHRRPKLVPVHVMSNTQPRSSLPKQAGQRPDHSHHRAHLNALFRVKRKARVAFPVPAAATHLGQQAALVIMESGWGRHAWCGVVVGELEQRRTTLVTWYMLLGMYVVRKGISRSHRGNTPPLPLG